MEKYIILVLTVLALLYLNFNKKSSEQKEFFNTSTMSVNKCDILDQYQFNTKYQKMIIFLNLLMNLKIIKKLLSKKIKITKINIV